VPVGNTGGTDPTWGRFGANGLGSTSLRAIGDVVSQDRDLGNGMVEQHYVDPDGRGLDVDVGTF
jgi:hypothetical protein